MPVQNLLRKSRIVGIMIWANPVGICLTLGWRRNLGYLESDKGRTERLAAPPYFERCCLVCTGNGR